MTFSKALRIWPCSGGAGGGVIGPFWREAFFSSLYLSLLSFLYSTFVGKSEEGEYLFFSDFFIYFPCYEAGQEGFLRHVAGSQELV